MLKGVLNNGSLNKIKIDLSNVTLPRTPDFFGFFIIPQAMHCRHQCINIAVDDMQCMTLLTPFDVFLQEMPHPRHVHFLLILNMIVMVCGSADKLPVVELRGYELTEDYLAENGFRRPIMVRCKDGLDLRVPSEHFSVQDVEDHVGMFSLVCFCFVLQMTDLTFCEEVQHGLYNRQKYSRKDYSVRCNVFDGKSRFDFKASCDDEIMKLCNPSACLAVGSLTLAVNLT